MKIAYLALVLVSVMVQAQDSTVAVFKGKRYPFRIVIERGETKEYPGGSGYWTSKKLGIYHGTLDGTPAIVQCECELIPGAVYWGRPSGPWELFVIPTESTHRKELTVQYHKKKSESH